MSQHIPQVRVKDGVLLLGGSVGARERLLKDALSQDLIFTSLEESIWSNATYKIDTKYYTAPIQLLVPHSVSDQTRFSSLLENHYRSGLGSIVDHVGALIALHMDSETADYKQFLESAVDTLEPEVLLYVVDDGSMLLPSTTEWCHENGFEIVSLAEPLPEEDIDEDDKFSEKTGAARVLEALESHMWAHMEYKTTLRPLREGLSQQQNERNETPTMNATEDDLKNLPVEVQASFDQFMKYVKLSDRIESNDAAKMGELEDDGLLASLGPLQQIRSHLSGLEDGQRRAMAARVVMTLMDAFGDDMDDMEMIEDELDDDAEDE